MTSYLSVSGGATYFGKSSELHVHLLNVNLFPWSLGPILYTGLTWEGEWRYLICDFLTEEKQTRTLSSARLRLTMLSCVNCVSIGVQP